MQLTKWGKSIAGQLKENLPLSVLNNIGLPEASTVPQKLGYL